VKKCLELIFCWYYSDWFYFLNFFPLLTGLFDQDFIFQGHQQDFKDIFENCMRGRGTADFECTLRTKSGKQAEVLLNASPRTDTCGRIVGMLGVVQDITERKQAEKEKLLIAQELQTFLSTANSLIFGIDAEGLVSQWNKMSALVTGFSLEEVLGKKFVQVQ
jgi:PAS domain-containing protein